MSHNQINNQLIKLFKKQKFEDALELAKKTIKKYPDNPLALKIIGLIYANSNKFSQAVTFLQKTLDFNSQDTDACNYLGICLKKTGRISEAVDCYENFLDKNPKQANIYYQLALLFEEIQENKKAELNYRKSLEINKGFLEAYNSLANLLKNSGRVQEAEENYLKILEIDPGISGIYHNLGVLYHDNGQLDNAEKYYRKALNLDPKSASTYFSLGNLLKINNKYKEAEESYLKSLLLNPNNAQVYFNLALIYGELNELYKAEEYYIKAINLNGNFTSAYYNLGQLYQESLHLDKAKYCYEQAIKTDTNYTQAYRNLGNILGDIGQFDQAEKYYEKALQIDPTKHDIYSNKLFKSNYNPDLSDEQLFNYYKEYENKFTKHLYKDDIKHNNSKILNRKLKIGYVSPDFRQHAVRNFLEPLLSNHNKKDFLVYLYSNSEKEDDITKNYKQYADQWLCIKDINDEDLSEKIKDDEIDILVDLAGHTKNNRLMLFAGKPAPVSMTWLGFGYTTGISAIDYFLTDNIHVPKKYDHLFAETPYRIKNPAFVYRPNKDMGDVSPLPYLSNGYITFGTLTRSIRINHKTIRAWSQVLKSVPNSKLIINSQNYKNQKAKDDLINKFQAYGIEKDRLDIGFDTPPWDILRKMDIGIDCFPHNSGTTLFETLYMGIPFITLEDKPALGRLGSSILHGLNKKEWIAKTESEYIEKLIKLASNVKELEHIRKNLREQMHQSPLMDEPGFTKRIENMYKDMFKKWIKQQ